MKKLFLAYMGAASSERLMEDHEIVMVCAEDMEEAKEFAIKKTKLVEGVHVDFILEVDNIDGYDVTLEKGGDEKIKKVSDYCKI